MGSGNDVFDMKLAAGIFTRQQTVFTTSTGALNDERRSSLLT
jgi:hypothetical protein